MLCSTNDWVGLAFQLVSISFWIVTQVPQFIDNWKNGSAEALSPIFLADWLLVLPSSVCIEIENVHR
jgi:PQ loop repeat